MPPAVDQSSVSVDVSSSSGLHRVSSHGSTALDLIRKLSQSVDLIDSPPTSGSVEIDERNDDALLLDSLPSTCGISDEQTQFPIYSSCIFFVDDDWTWDWILQYDCLCQIPAASSFIMHSFESSFASWPAQNIFSLSTNDAVPLLDECMTLEGEFAGVDLSRLPRSFSKNCGCKKCDPKGVVPAATR